MINIFNIMKLKIKKDYNQKKINNPFLKRRKRENIKYKQKIWKIILILVILLVIFAIFLFCTYAKFFNIKEIQISGTKRVAVGDIEKIARKQTMNTRFKIIPQINIIFFNSNSLISQLEQKYHFKDVLVKKSILKKNIFIKINENKPVFIVKEDKIYYYVDNNNYIVKISTSTPITKLPIIINKFNELVKNEQITLNKVYIDHVINFFNELSSIKDNKLNINGFVFDNDVVNSNKFNKRLIKVLIINGPIILFGEKKPFDEVRELVLIKDRLGDDFLRKEYIDMRYGDKIFSK